MRTADFSAAKLKHHSHTAYVKMLPAAHELIFLNRNDPGHKSHHCREQMLIKANRNPSLKIHVHRDLMIWDLPVITLLFAMFPGTGHVRYTIGTINRYKLSNNILKR
jgi:hypothetical protein